MGLIFYIGVILIVLAVAGFVFKLSGKEIPFINSVSNQLILAAIGLAFIWVNQHKTEPPELYMVTHTYDSISFPASRKVFVDTILPRIDMLIKHGDNIVDSIRHGDENAWENIFFHYTNSVYDAIRPIEIFNRNGGTYQTKWYVLSRGRRVDGDSKYDSSFALNATLQHIEWLKNLRAGLDSSKYK